MAAGETRIIDGARSPGDLERLAAMEDEKERQRRVLSAAAPPKVVEKRKKYDFPTRFVSGSPNYLLMLDKTSDLPDGTVKHIKFSVRFEQGMLDITHKTYPVATRIVSELMTKCSGYGLGRSFWDAEEAEVALAEAARKQTIASVQRAKADPELRAALLAELQADDFDLKDK